MLTASEELELIELLEAEYIEKCRISLWDFCKFQTPTVYLDERIYLKDLCDTLQGFVTDQLKDKNGKSIQKLMINMPPRHGKTLTAENLTKWFLGRSPRSGVIAVSYSQDLSGRFAKEVRDSIQEERVYSSKTVFSDVFPKVTVKRGDAAYNFWSLNGSHFSFLATSPGSKITGVGAQLGIIDDLIKDAEEAFNENILESHQRWYRNTYQSRLESGAKELLIMTRWATGDLCGWLQREEPELWHVVTFPAYDGVKMLDESVLSLEEFLRRQENTDPVIFEGNYQQKPFDSTDKLYPSFKTYAPDELPIGGYVESYTDTADEGEDYLASIVYRVFKNTAYVLDVLYTQEPMEKTETATAKMLSSHRCQTAWIESNNGGRGFSRNVERIMRETIEYASCNIQWFHQSENKVARILTHSATVVNSVIFPVGWENRWPLLYRHLKDMGRMSKWRRDDCADMLTGIVEKSLGKNRKDPVKVVPLGSRWG